MINIVAFAVLAILWLAFGIALLFNRGLLDTAWESFRSWNLILQLLVGLLALPVVLGLWIWETSWPMWLRLILVIGLGIATIYMFFPKETRSHAEGSPAKP
jgi:hypothetical protein